MPFEVNASKSMPAKQHGQRAPATHVRALTVGAVIEKDAVVHHNMLHRFGPQPAIARIMNLHHNRKKKQKKKRKKKIEKEKKIREE